MRNVNCPVFIMHGTKDTKIPYEHALMLSNNCLRLHALWSVENAGHCGIESEK
jgi:pimeloyl-ACP methyl ester carboxylesterase